MMMPANFSVVAENEMTYVVGGGLLEAIGSVTAQVWTPASVKTFNTNLVTIVGNSFMSKILNATLGVMFSGVWGGDDGELSMSDAFSALYKKTNGKDDQSTLNKVMTTIGLGAAIYNLGTATTKNSANFTKWVGKTQANGSFVIDKN